jgi:hypothetical protein
MQVDNLNTYWEIRQQTSIADEFKAIFHAKSILDQLEIPRSGLKHCRKDTSRIIYHFYSYTNLVYIFFEELKKVIELISKLQPVGGR